MSLPRSWSSLGAVLLPLVAGLPACGKNDPEQCSQAQEVTRQAISVQDFALARQWRDRAYKQCDDTGVLAALDKELVDREAAVNARREADEKQKKETLDLIKLFVDFVAQNRAAPAGASSAPVCEPPPAQAGQENKERFCASARQVGARYAFQVKYWDADHAAFRFATTPEDPVACQDLGGTVQKTWDVPAAGGKMAKRSRCDLGGALAGLTAVVSGAAQAEVHVFSPAYLERDPGWRPILEGP